MKKALKTEFIAVGTELLLGQIADTNAQWISEQFGLNGINMFYHTVVGDNLQRISKVFEKAHERSDVIVVTGGLGPTEDDLTREAFQQMSSMAIIEDEMSMNKIEQFFINRGSKMTPNNRRQARVFKDTTVLDNKTGMAPGMIVHYEGRDWIFLPGVPREMKQLVTDDVIPYLLNKNGQTVLQSTVLRFIGIGESTLEHELQEMIHNQENPTIAPLAQKDGVTVRLTAKADTREETANMLAHTKAQVLAKIGQYFYGTDNEKIEAKVMDLLKAKDKRIAVAESLTGGMFTDKLVALQGASDVLQGGIVCYDTFVKTDLLNISTEIIEEKGTVSKECASQLAKNVCNKLNASIGISFTGIAGPDEVEGKRIGTVYISIYDNNGYEHVEEYYFQGNRDQIRYRTTLKGFELLFNYLKLKN